MARCCASSMIRFLTFGVRDDHRVSFWNVLSSDEEYRSGLVDVVCLFVFVVVAVIVVGGERRKELVIPRRRGRMVITSITFDFNDGMIVWS